MKQPIQKIGALLLGASMLTTQMAAANSDANDNDKIKVMSRNIYLGADIFPVIAVAEQQAQLPPEQQNPLAIPLAVGEVFQTVQMTNFPERAQALAIRWLVGFSRSRNDKTMKDRLMNELLDASAGRGGSMKKREDTHKMADANKAFSHFAW